MNFSKENDDLYEEFLRLYPVEKMRIITLEEYTNLEKTSFCYWVENKLNDWGNIHGATSYKFGIYKWYKKPEIEKTNILADDKYAWQDRFGKTADEAFTNIRNKIVQIIEAAQSEQYEAIDDIDVSEMFKWKIAFLYSNKKLINWFSKEALFCFSKHFGKEFDDNAPTSELQRFLITQKGNKSLEEFGNELLPVWQEYQAQKTPFKCWLLTWNKDNWEWKDYDEWCLKTKHGEKYNEPWTCYSKQPVLNDHVFLMKTGAEPKGIIAHGIVTKTSYDAPHYDIEKAGQGITLPHIGVEFDLIQNYKTESIISLETLKSQFPNQNWSPQSSGIQIKCDVIELLKLWNETKGEFEMSKTQKIVELLKSKKNIILQGAPGTGKTYTTAEIALSLCGEEIDFTNHAAVMKKYQEYVDGGRIAFVTFHQSMDYEDFVEGIKPKTDGAETVTYEIEDGIFKVIAKKALEAKPSSEAKPYILIIDEINRGNVSKIFGELITLLEADKRTSGNHPLSVILPYSKEKFEVPSNLYIIGTMNTTDRSVGSIDYAVRRRFSFVTLEADKNVVLAHNGGDEASTAVRLFDAVKSFLKKNRIDMDIDDLMVGHSYFLAKDEDELQMKWEYDILPLLREYYKDGIIKTDVPKNTLIGEFIKQNPSESQKADDE